MNFLDSFISALKPRHDDDVTDRLNYYYTTLIILILSITISAKQYVGQPIQCWVPAQFTECDSLRNTGAWEQYAENYCFVQNTYWLPLIETIPKDTLERDQREIGYYQWVPFILAIEALLFYIPCIIWRLMNWQSGINVQSVSTMAADTGNVSGENRHKSVRIISKHIEDALELQREFGSEAKALGALKHCGKTNGVYITMLYLFVKILYLANVMGQFFLLNAFLGTRYRFWGAEILADLAGGREWQDSGHFPRVTMCDFEVRVLGNLHRYTIQCVLMINMFNEKIFLFLWWWFLIVAITTGLNFLYWLLTLTIYERRKRFISRYLRITGSIGDSDNDKRSLHRFVTRVLRPDGVMILKTISNNAGDLVVTEIVDSLWLSYREKYLSARNLQNRGLNQQQTRDDQSRFVSRQQPGDADIIRLDDNHHVRGAAWQSSPSAAALLPLKAGEFVEKLYHHLPTSAASTSAASAEKRRLAASTAMTTPLLPPPPPERISDDTVDIEEFLNA